jgi:hypothetical protein
LGAIVGVCLSFNNYKSKDGIGAQVIRIIDVFSLSRKFKLGYFHSPVLQFDSNPGDNLNTFEDKLNFLFQLEDFLNLECLSCNETHRIRQLNISKVFGIPGALNSYFTLKKIVNFFLKRHELFMIDNPYRLTSRYPNIRNHFIRLTGVFNQNVKNDDICRIHIHIRRGLISENILSNRFIPTSWYLSLLLPIQATLNSCEVGYEFTIHTDVHEGNMRWSSAGVSAETMVYLQNGGNELDKDSNFTLSYEDFRVSLSELRNIKIVTELNPLESWKLMQEADILVIGKSSFSFVGALLNQSAQVISPIGFYRGPSDWTYVADTGELPINFLNLLREKYS